MAINIAKYNSPNCYSREGCVPKFYVLHIQEGYYDSGVTWHCTTAAGVGFHFLIAKDGRVAQLVDISKGAWTQGLNVDQYQYSKLAYVRNNPTISPNRYCVSFECEGFWSEAKGKLGEVQLNALVETMKFAQAEIKRIYGFVLPFDREHVVPHSDINPTGRANCNGQDFQWDELFRRLNVDSSTPSSPTASKKYLKINKTFNDGKWNADQKGAFEFTNDNFDYILERAIEFYMSAGLSDEYKIFDPSGNVVYPAENTEKIKALLAEIETLKGNVSELTKSNETLAEKQSELLDEITNVGALYKGSVTKTRVLEEKIAQIAEIIQ